MAWLALVFCHGTEATAALNETINEKKTVEQNWVIDDSVNNKVTFNGSGAIFTKSEYAFLLNFGSNYTNNQKQASLLTLEFANPATTIETTLDDPANLDAHIYVENTANNGWAMGTELRAYANLAIAGTESYGPTVVAHSAPASGDSSAAAIHALYINSITVGNAASLVASSSSSGDFVVSAGIGSALPGEPNSVIALSVRFGNNNRLSSSSSSFFFFLELCCERRDRGSLGVRL